MAVSDLVVEDGSGLVDADAYISIDYADQYHANHGNTDWEGLDSDTKAIYIRKATSYIEQVYFSSWKGNRSTNRQSLSWPRIGVQEEANKNLYFGYRPYYSFANEILGNVIPNNVKMACAILALKVDSEDNNDLAPDLEQEIVREVVGPIDTTYSQSSPQYKRYRSVSLLIAPLTRSNISFTLNRV